MKIHFTLTDIVVNFINLCCNSGSVYGADKGMLFVTDDYNIHTSETEWYTHVNLVFTGVRTIKSVQFGPSSITLRLREKDVIYLWNTEESIREFREIKQEILVQVVVDDFSDEVIRLIEYVQGSILIKQRT